MKKLKIRIPALALLASTVLFWSLYDRYEPAGALLLKAPSLADGINIRGHVSESNGGFALQVSKGDPSAHINFPLPAATDYKYIRVSGRIKVKGVVVGKHSWNCARLMISQYDANHKWIPGHHGLIAEWGSKDWKRYQDVFEISSRAERMVLALHQKNLEKVTEFDQITAQPVRLRASFIGWQISFFGLWLAAAILYFPYCRLDCRKLNILILLNVMAILAGTLMPSNWIASSSIKFKTTLRSFHASEISPRETNFSNPKQTPKVAPLYNPLNEVMRINVEAHQAGHFILFASLCFLVYLSAALERQHPIYFFKVGIDIFIFAAITEALQFLTLDRTAGVLDLRIDLYGMAAAFLLFLIVLPFIRARESRSAALNCF